MTLDHGESFYLGIYIDTEKCSPVGNYELGIAYYDCFGCRYMQTFDLIVEREKDGSYVSRLDYVSRKAMIADPASSNWASANLIRIWEMLPRIVCELINVIGSALCSSLGFHVDKAFWLPFLVGKPFMMILNGA